jgi:NADH-quinone oxidoreductase subunit E
VHATRGRRPSFRDTERTLAGFDDGLAAAPSVDDKMLAGLRAAKERGMTAPRPEGGN